MRELAVCSCVQYGQGQGFGAPDSWIVGRNDIDPSNCVDLIIICRLASGDSCYHLLRGHLLPDVWCWLLPGD